MSDKDDIYADTIMVAQAPRFSGGAGQPSLATLYLSHYDRLMAVVDAARTGNKRLIRLALAELDEHGGNDEPPMTPKPTPPINVTLSGQSYDREQIRELLAQIGSALGDGMTLKVT